ncbi:MAG: hypothetical protein RLZZ563_306, partial [Pseudomonadota bacterium]
MTNVVIVSAARTAVGSFNGAFAATPAHELGAAVIEAVVARAGVDKTEVEETILGQVLTAGQGQNPARQAHIKAGLPKEGSAWSLNQVCGSGLRAVALGAQHVQLGDAKIIIAGGQESMSLSPHVAHLRAGQKMGDMKFIDLLEVNGAIRFSDYNTIGKTTAWTVGGRYRPIPELTFRGTYSVAVRAPNLAELFGPVRAATIGLLADPCAAQNVNSGSSFRVDNCLEFVPAGFNPANFASAFRPGITGGNPNLQEEEAETFTAGFVWQPTGFLSGLSVIADYYDIEITDAVGSL